MKTVLIALLVTVGMAFAQAPPPNPGATAAVLEQQAKALDAQILELRNELEKNPTFQRWLDLQKKSQDAHHEAEVMRWHEARKAAAPAPPK
jgi:hypothetical protein